MARRFMSKEKIINKITHHGIIEQNMITGEKILINKKDNNFNLCERKRTNDVFVRKIGKKKKMSLKKSYQRQIRLQQNLQKTKNEINKFLQLNINTNEIPLSTSEHLYYERTNNQETKADNSTNSNSSLLLERGSGTTNFVQNQNNCQPIYENSLLNNKNKEVNYTLEQKKNLMVDTKYNFTKPIEKRTKYYQKFVNTINTSKNFEDKFTTNKTKETHLIVEDKLKLDFSNKKIIKTSNNKETYLKNEEKNNIKSSNNQKNIKAKQSYLQSTSNEKNKNNNFIQEDITLDSKKLQKLENKVKKINTLLEKSKAELPSKKKLKVKRVFSEDIKKAKLKLQFEKEIIPQEKRFDSKPLIIKKSMLTLKNEALYKIHQKINEVENENISIKSIHKTEQAIENYVHGKHITHSAFSFIRNSPYRKLSKLERKEKNANINYMYKKTLKQNPNLQSNIFSRFMQKQKIKKQYIKSNYKAKQASYAIRNISNLGVKTSKLLLQFISKNPTVVITIIIILLFFLITNTLLNTISIISTSGIAPVISSSYVASDIDIDKAELAYTEWETNLLVEAWNAENSHSGYDQYQYNFGDISHNPYELMAYLTAKYQEFKYSDIESDLWKIFKEQYKLDFTESIEMKYDSYTGEPYEWRILNVSITTQSFSNVIFSKLNAKQLQLFKLYMQTKGNRQYMISPFDFNWIPKITSYYGYRIQPITNNKDYHKGIDISVPIGTNIQAGHNGIVTMATYDSTYGYYIIIDDESGLQSKYAHCDTLFVNVGQKIKKGDIIAKSGNTGDSTGAHLHLEVLKNGKYLNPLYFVVTNDNNKVPEFGVPSLPIGDGSYAALIAEAEKYLGFPYVWGGSIPSTSFDCSGFVCWVYTQSGVYNLPRTTAQGIFNQCVPISSNDVQPGDLIFFTGTYSTTSPVTHIGIYTGNGIMLHCGNPIGYTSINTDYWKKHFYSFGRLN